MRWQKISLSILTAMLLGWTASAAISADIDTEKSFIEPVSGERPTSPQAAAVKIKLRIPLKQ